MSLFLGVVKGAMRLSDVLKVVIPAYNESQNIERTVADWYPIVESHDGGGCSRIIFVDDGSTDDTYEKLRACAQDHPLLEVVTKENGGHGSALVCGYGHALQTGADYVFQTDADGQTDPRQFESFWAERESYEAQFGNRIVRKDGWGRILVEKLLCRILKHYFGVTIPDANAPFRLMSAAFLSTYLPKVPEDNDLPNVMLSTYAVYYGHTVRFVPVTFDVRKAGKTSLNMKKIAGIGFGALFYFKRLSKAL